MAKTDITPEGMEAQIQQEAPKVLWPKNGPTIKVTKNW